MKKVLLVTTANLVTNPRMVKEMQLLCSYAKVEVLAFRLGNWSDKLEREADYGRAAIIYLNATRKPFLPWATTTVMEKVAAIAEKLKTSVYLTAYASSKRSYQLVRHMDGYSKKEYDLVIAHNMGALLPAYHLSYRWNIPFAFDMEDYHPGEKITNTNPATEMKRRSFLLQSLLPQASYVSFASPLIREATLQLCPQLDREKTLLTCNSFPVDEFSPGESMERHDKLRMVWFSQNIARGRGIEDILPILAKYSDRLEVHLIGNLNKDIQDLVQQYASFVHCLPPLPQKQLHLSLSQYDIGLALEMPGEDQNRSLALTNKIFAYLQAGLYILATATKAQAQLLEQYPAHGCCFELAGLVSQLEEILGQKEWIRNNRMSRFNAALSDCWENESRALMEKWEAIGIVQHQFEEII